MRPPSSQMHSDCPPDPPDDPNDSPNMGKRSVSLVSPTILLTTHLLNYILVFLRRNCLVRFTSIQAVTYQLSPFLTFLSYVPQ